MCAAGGDRELASGDEGADTGGGAEADRFGDLGGGEEGVERGR